MAVKTITLNTTDPRGESQTSWTGCPDYIYRDTEINAYFADANCTQLITSITPPTRDCWRFEGFFSGFNSATGTQDQFIDADGNFTDAIYDTDKMPYSRIQVNWHGTKVAYKLTLSDGSGAGGDGSLYYSIAGGAGSFFRTLDFDGDFVDAVTRPYRVGYSFAGYWSNSNGTGTQYFDAAGKATDALYALSLSANTTIYAKWDVPKRITVKLNDGTNGSIVFYYDQNAGKFYSDGRMQEELATLAVPDRPAFSFAGCYTGTATTAEDRCVRPDGTMEEGWIPTGNVTLYAQWDRLAYVVTLNKQNGAGGTSALYYKLDGSGLYLDGQCEDALGERPIDRPVRDGYAFRGYCTAKSGGDEHIDYTGAVVGLAYLDADLTLYAHWLKAYKVTFNMQQGANGTEALWYSPSDDTFYWNAECSSTSGPEFPESGIAIPERECWAFLGYYTATSGGQQFIDANGDAGTDFADIAVGAPRTLYARWERRTYKVKLDDNGGADGAGAVYIDGSSASYYGDDLGAGGAITAVSVPTREGYTFLGYYESGSGGSRYVDESGQFLVGADHLPAADGKLVARWQGKQYAVTFDYNGGAGDMAGKTVTMGEAFGTLPTITSVAPRSTFDGWYVGGRKLSAATLWNVPADTTLRATWRYFFGNVTDWFRLASDALVPISSDAGDSVRRVTVAHNGRAAGGVDAVSGTWRNPTVTYMVVRDTTVSVSLGAAYAAQKSGGAMTVSGYMITSVEIDTRGKAFPVVTVTATANEGADAINRWAVAVFVKARARPQNLMSAVSGGGELQSMRLVATCDAVVLEEAMMPCASDIVNGRWEATAETMAANNENPPAAGGGFARSALASAEVGADYKRFTLSARKEMQ